MSAPTKCYTDAEVATMRASAFMSGAAWADRRGMVSLAEIENEANRRYPQSMFAASSSSTPLSETPNERTQRCVRCGKEVREIEGTWPCDPEFVGDRGPEGFVCYECPASLAPLSEPTSEGLND